MNRRLVASVGTDPLTVGPRLRSAGLRVVFAGLVLASALGAPLPGAGPRPAAAAESEPIAIGHRHTLRSEILGEERAILISLPPGYETGEERYPVLVFTDGDVHIVQLRGTVSFHARNGLMPEMILVGVPNTDRTRDLTPTHAPLPQLDGPPQEFPTSGGGDRFLDFIERELLPWVDAEYRTHPYRVLAGHSFGGLLALHAFFTRPQLFGAVLAASPSLVWDDELPLKEAQAYFEGAPALPRTLFFTMADEEAGAPSPIPSERMTAFLESVDADGFRWRFLPMQDENHGTVGLRTWYWGLREVYEGWRLPNAPPAGYPGPLPSVLAHYDGLSERFGYTVEPTEGVINLAGYGALFAGETDAALEFFRFNVERHPESANAHDSLGEALERKGDAAAALAGYTRAWELGRAAEHPFVETYRTNMERMAAAVKAEAARAGN